jgi:hypothetical protein
LTPHLEVLSQGFALPRPSGSPGQLDLFPAQAVTEALSTQVSKRPGAAALPAANKRRRSA